MKCSGSGASAISASPSSQSGWRTLARGPRVPVGTGVAGATIGVLVLELKKRQLPTVSNSVELVHGYLAHSEIISKHHRLGAACTHCLALACAADVAAPRTRVPGFCF